jgi:glycogen debranching enzyme
VEYLNQIVNENLWAESETFYFDRWRDGNLSGVKSVGAYWALLADVISGDRLSRFIEHLKNPKVFNRPHRVPSLSADHPCYSQKGDYWQGGVWAPTNYMILRGLTQVNEDELAYEIAFNHLDNVLKVFENTGTLWENYAPEYVSPGNRAKADFVGWSGLTPVAVLLEYVFGLRPDVPNGRLLWDVRLLDEHGIEGYPYGKEGVLELSCARRSSEIEEPVINSKSNIAINLEVRWSGGSKIMKLDEE